jgi:flavin-dependent dehydrogenase
MYDAIIVGTRCAGAPVAMLLARKGYRVLGVDKSTFPSDIMSTHFIQQAGVMQLQKWGLLEIVRATGCPDLKTVAVFMNGVKLPSPPPPPGTPEDAPASICPRRTVLDKILVDAAVAAGAEIREGYVADGLTLDDDAVTGVSGHQRGTSERTSESARIVVGADGMHSVVARDVQAPTYNERPSLTCVYYTYWRGVEMEGAEIHMGDGAGALAFPTNDGAVCVAVGRANDAFDEYRADYENQYMLHLKNAAPSLAERMANAERTERYIGTADVPNFFRKPYGPGWALVGDAGYHKDPITGLGIMDAFRDAELLADAIDEGFSCRAAMDDALAGYQAKRDEAATPLYEFTCMLASFPDPMALIQGGQQESAAAS